MNKKNIKVKNYKIGEGNVRNNSVYSLVSFPTFFVPLNFSFVLILRIFYPLQIAIIVFIYINYS